MRTICERGSSFPLSRHLIASFPSSHGSWRHIQSSNESKSFAKSSRYQSKSFGIPNNFLLVEMPTAACKYSLFATSNSFSTWDAVYTLTFIQQSSWVNNNIHDLTNVTCYLVWKHVWWLATTCASKSYKVPFWRKTWTGFFFQRKAAHILGMSTELTTFENDITILNTESGDSHKWISWIYFLVSD